MYEVYIYSAGGVQEHFTDCETEQEALALCDSYNYEWIDGNCFVWYMDYRKISK